MDTSGSDSTAATPAGTPAESSPTESADVRQAEVSAADTPSAEAAAEVSAAATTPAGTSVDTPVDDTPEPSSTPAPPAVTPAVIAAAITPAATAPTPAPPVPSPAALAAQTPAPTSVSPVDSPTPTAPTPADVASTESASTAAATPTPADVLPAEPAAAAPTPAAPAAATPTPADAVPAAAVPSPADAVPGAAVPGPAAAGAGGGTSASEYGRIDAEGNVYVRTAAGERAIGSWQAGTAEEGLHHFQRRYDDLVTEIELLEARLQGGMSDAAHTKSSAARLRESLADAHVIGNLDALATRLDALIEASSAKADEQKVAKARAREEATTRKQTLVAEAEDIANNSTQWKVAGDRLRDILTEWKTIRGVDRKTDTELWRRYAAARDGFSRRRGSHFAGLDQQRKQVQGIKEQLVTEAESLAESTDWQSTANRLKQLMNDWKAAGRAPREAEDQLWKRFRAAQDTFFAHRSATFSERDAELKANQTKKEELLAEAERIDPDSDLRAAQSAMRDVQARWEDIGRVPREAVAQLDRRLRAIEDRVKVATDVEWRRGSVQSNPLLAQMREQVAKAEKQLERAKTQGDQRRIAEAEKALASKRQFLDLAEQAG